MLAKWLLAPMTAALVALAFAMLPASAADPFKGSGFQLDKSDLVLVNEASEKLYLSDNVKVGTTETWNNPETGASGTVTLIGKPEYNGMPCRRLRHDITLKRPTDSYRFTVDRCRTPGGEWKIVVP